MASNQASNTSNASPSNLLSPNAALEQAPGRQLRDRRRSTLSGNGFFIDYSCTRRRSSAVRDHQALDRKQQFLRAHVSPVRLSRNSFCVGQQQLSQPVSPARAQSRLSRASYSAAGSSGMQLMMLPVHAPNALAGSRKTSIFDPAGHSVASQLMAARRKSTMIAGGCGGGQTASPTQVLMGPGGPMGEPASNTLLSVAKSAARSGKATTKAELAQHVPVIGCSPTSIKASLAALDETRRYERLLRKLQRHKQRKERRRKLREKRLARGLDVDGTEPEWAEGETRGEWLPSSPRSGGGGSFRRKSLRALREAAHLLQGGFRRGAARAACGRPSVADTFSVSSMSFASSRSSLPSLDRYELNNDHLFPDSDTMADLGHPLAEHGFLSGSSSSNSNGSSASGGSRTGSCGSGSKALGRTSGQQQEEAAGQSASQTAKRSIIKSAMRRLAASISGTNSVGRKQLQRMGAAASDSRRPTLGANLRSVSMSGGMNYWYYYYYLRENSVDAIDDLPIGSGAATTEAERRSQLHINYSLARLEILNSSTDPVAKMAEKLSQAVSMANEAAASSASPGDHYEPIFSLLDFSQSTDVSLTLSSSSSTESSCQTSPSHGSDAASSRQSCSSGARASDSSDATSPSRSSSRSSSFSAATSVNRRPRPGQLSGSSTRSGRRSPSGRRGSGESAADDERTSLDVDTSRLSPSISRQNSRNYDGAPKTHRRPLDHQRKSMSSRESITGSSQQQQLQLQQQPEAGSLQAAEARQQTTTVYSGGSRQGSNVAELPGSRAAVGHVARHSHNNLAVVVSAQTAAVGAGAGSSSSSILTGGKRSSSFINRANEDNEEELDDFERLNRCHRGYKTLLDNQTQSAAQVGEVGANSRSNQYNWTDKTISGRNSANRLSVRSARCGRSSSSSARRRRDSRCSKRGSRISMSWDTLNLDDELTNSGSGHVGRAFEDAADASSTQQQRHAPLPVWLAATQPPQDTFMAGGPQQGATFRGTPARGWPAQASLPASLLGGHSFKSSASSSGPTSDHWTSASARSLNGPNQQLQQQHPRLSERCTITTTTTTTADEDGSWLADNRGESLMVKNHHHHLQQQQPQAQQTPSKCWPVVYSSSSKLALDNESGCDNGDPRYYYYCDFHLKQYQQQQRLHQRDSSAAPLARKSSHSPPSSTSSSRDITQRQQTHSDGRATKHASTVNLDPAGPPGTRREPKLEPDTIGLGCRQQQQHDSSCSQNGSSELARSDSGRVGKQMESPTRLRAGLRPHPSVSLLLVPDWSQQQANDPPELEGSGRRGCLACSASDRQPVWRAERQLDLRDDRVQTQSIRSNETAASGSSAQVQLRARAHSTGAGSESSARNAASHATMERARFLSGQAIGAPNEPLEHFRRQYRAHSAKETLLLAPRGVEARASLVPDGDQKQAPSSGSAMGRKYNTEGEKVGADSKTGEVEEKQRKEQHEEHRRKKDLLNKKSFTCMLVGARQTGKRTIVKCSVKLLNEFKLAAFEYKKEKMLTKLMDCSEQLQGLLSQQQEVDNEDRRISLAHADFPRSRINSWLGEGGNGGAGNGDAGGSNSGLSAVNRLLHLPNVGKRRLNSTASALTAHGLEQHQQQPINLQHRRHTAIDHCPQPDKDNQSGSSKQDNEAPVVTAYKERFLRVDTPNMLTTCDRSSDTRINYANDSDHSDDSESVKQLQVPVPDNPFNCPNQCSEPSNNNGHSSGRPTQQQPSIPLGQSVDDCGQLRYQDAIRLRNLSIQASQRRKPMLSLREMNKRLIRILFKTRRQLSDRFLVQKQESEQQQTNTCQTDELQWDWPDSFIVVYSISDRDSFEYAKYLVGQLRSIKQDLSLPIILVANKIDLERAKVVKSEEGRSLARKNACKFLEISCTVGFNMDNLLVGLRTQLILKHHVTLNSIIRQGKILRAAPGNKQANERDGSKVKGSDNILVRFYKRYITDNHELTYDCDNFSKL